MLFSPKNVVPISSIQETTSIAFAVSGILNFCSYNCLLYKMGHNLDAFIIWYFLMCLFIFLFTFLFEMSPYYFFCCIGCFYFYQLVTVLYIFSIKPFIDYLSCKYSFSFGDLDFLFLCAIFWYTEFKKFNGVYQSLHLWVCVDILYFLLKCLKLCLFHLCI